MSNDRPKSPNTSSIGLYSSSDNKNESKLSDNDIENVINYLNDRREKYNKGMGGITGQHNFENSDDSEFPLAKYLTNDEKSMMFLLNGFCEFNKNQFRQSNENVEVTVQSRYKTRKPESFKNKEVTFKNGYCIAIIKIPIEEFKKYIEKGRALKSGRELGS